MEEMRIRNGDRNIFLMSLLRVKLGAGEPRNRVQKQP